MYIEKCRTNRAELIPALWEVSREGHNWVNQEEMYDSIDNLLQVMLHQIISYIFSGFTMVH